MKKMWFLIVSLWLLMVMTSCANDGSPQNEGDVQHEVSIMLDWYPNAVHTYLYVAEAKGYFAEEGVHVDIQFPANPTDPLNLAAAGQVTMGLYYQPDVIMARANEQIPIKSIASIVRAPLNHIVLLEESPLHSPRDLEGMKLGYPGIALNEALLNTMVSHDGGNPELVQLIDVGFELSTSLVMNRVDAVIGTFINHEVPVLSYQGHETRHFNPVDYGVPAYHEIVLVTSEETWAEEKDALQAFWRAANKGYEFMKSQPEEALHILLDAQDEANFPLIEEVEKESMEVLLGMMEEQDAPFGSQHAENWREVRDWMYDAGLLESLPDADEFFVEIE